jgi:ABC-type phosphate transport system auxiliary subunit
MEIIRSPHDKFFGRVLSVKKNAVSLLRNILPESLQKHLVIEDIFTVKYKMQATNCQSLFR